MPEPETTPPLLNDLATIWVNQLLSPTMLKRIERMQKNAYTEGHITAAGAIRSAEIEAISTGAEGVEFFEKLVRPIIAPLLTAMIRHMLGLEISERQLEEAAKPGEGSSLGRAVADTILGGMTPTATSLEPGDEAARRFMGMVSTLILNSWSEGIFFSEIAGSLQVTHSMEAFTKLGEELIGALGISRLMRVALRPIVHTTIATPSEWKVNKTFRPTLLGAGEAIRQYTRGRWSREQLDEELARAGYSHDRIEALIASAVKSIALDAAMALARAGRLTHGDVIDILKQQGYQDATAELVLLADKEQRLAAIRDDVLSTLRSGYVSQDLSESQFRKLLREVVKDDDEFEEHMIVAGTLRELRVKRLSHGDVQNAVEAGVLAFRDYRAWLARESYEPDDALTLELVLRAKIDKQKTAEQHRAEAMAERAAEKAAKAEAAAVKKAHVEAELAQRRRGAASDLARAVVRGLIPITRYAEVLAGDFDDDTVQIMVALVEDDRQKYLDQQDAAAAAKQRAERRAIDVGAIESAVLAGVITIGDYRARLTQLKFDAADVAILADTLAAKLADRAAQAQAHLEAEIRAKRKAIDLGRFEQLVRRGARTMTQYDTVLVELGYDEAARADLRDLLQLRITDDATAARTRAAAEPALRSKGLSLDQFRRGVLLGLRTPADYEAFLVAQGFASNDTALLVAELADDVQQADAARQRRAQADLGGGTRTLPLSTIRRAVQLGVVSPDVYQLRLIEAGYAPDDVEIEMDLLVQEIADVQAARARRAVLDADAAARGLPLSAIERAVKLGAAPLDEYRARAAELGYAPDDIQLLADTLEREHAVLTDAQTRHGQIGGELAMRNLSLGQLDAAVKNSLMTLDEYGARLRELGYGDDDVELLVSLLVLQLNKSAAA